MASPRGKNFCCSKTRISSQFARNAGSTFGTTPTLPLRRAANAYGYRELYDMENDPAENYNVRTLYPDVEKEMEARYERAKQRFDPMRSTPLREASTVRFYD